MKESYIMHHLSWVFYTIIYVPCNVCHRMGHLKVLKCEVGLWDEHIYQLHYP